MYYLSTDKGIILSSWRLFKELLKEQLFKEINNVLNYFITAELPSIVSRVANINVFYYYYFILRSTLFRRYFIKMLNSSKNAEKYH